jgi:FlgD Ig-like domain
MFSTTIFIALALSNATIHIDSVSTSKALAYNIGRKLVRQPETKILNLSYEKGGWVMYTYSQDDGLTWATPESLKSGECPCIALDYNNQPWISYLHNDTIFCAVHNPSSDWTIVSVFNGSQAIKPGPPSLVLSPLNPANGIPIGYVTFPVYASGNNQSFIKCAKFNTTQVLIYNVDSTKALKDSSVSISLTNRDIDILHISWQQGDNVFYTEAAVLPDSWTRINWSTPYNLSNISSQSSKHPFTESYGDSVYVAWIEDNNIVFIGAKQISEPNNSWTYRTPIQSNHAKDYPVMRTNQLIAWQEQIDENNWEIYANIQGNTVNISETPNTSSQYCHIEVGYPCGNGEPIIPPDPEFVWTEQSYSYSLNEVKFRKYETGNNGNGGEAQKIYPWNWEKTNAALQPALYQNKPNPFAYTTTISYLLPKEDKISLKIYDASGKLVKTLMDGIQESGIHELQWDGRGFNLELLVNGVYFYTLETSNCTIVKKTIIMR